MKIKMTKCFITFTNEQDKVSIDEEIFENKAWKILGYLINNPKVMGLSGLRSFDLTNITLNVDILVCDDKRIRELNKIYREQDKPTDVLSFALFVDNPKSRIITNGEISLGEVIISAETAKSQADESNKSFNEQMYFLLGHGILHLLGFDHPTEEALRFMLKIQEEVLEKICNSSDPD